MKLHNTLTKKIEPLKPLRSGEVSIYSCGPTVYDHAHIGNLSSFIVADTLRRAIVANGLSTRHVMNFTDVDDKTIRRSAQEYGDMEPREALRTLTEKFGNIFVEDMQKVGNDTNALTFLRATDDATMNGMRELITDLHQQGFAYIADDGVYFSIDAYKKSGKTYGQLVEITSESTSSERIQNDEYDKESAHDFALWKTQKDGEPAWEFSLDGHNLAGRPGWHLECSVMSRLGAGQPFDIHTGGVDLAFPHHENEIAQSTAGKENPIYATIFLHNEHILVDGKKMSKSLGNFHTIADLIDRGINPLAFRMLVLQSHYRNQAHFTFDNVAAANNRLTNWRNVAALRHQTHETLAQAEPDDEDPSLAVIGAVREALSDDLNTPEALRLVDDMFSRLNADTLDDINHDALVQMLEAIDDMLGLQLLASTPDISDDDKHLIIERRTARADKNWQRSDEIRDELLARGIALKDTPNNTIWQYA